MRKSEPFDKRTVLSQRGEVLKLEYQLLTRTMPDGLESYGVCVRCTGKQKTEEVSIADLTTRYARVIALLRMLADGAVTPISVYEVLDTLL